MKGPSHLPMIIMVMGLPGSGKTYFARHLSERLGTPYVGSDQTRKEKHAMGKYSLKDRRNVYEEMLSRMEQHLTSGEPVILDATFYKEDLRLPFAILAKNKGIPLYKLWIEAPIEVIKERVSSRRDDSDADFAVYQKLSADFEPPSMPYLKMMSGQDNLDSMLVEAKQYLQL